MSERPKPDESGGEAGRDGPPEIEDAARDEAEIPADETNEG